MNEAIEQTVGRNPPVLNAKVNAIGQRTYLKGHGLIVVVYRKGAETFRTTVWKDRWGRTW